MNITNADHFTFNVYNSMFLTGQSGSGKSYLIHRLVKRYESAYKPNEMKYAFFDLKQCEFVGSNEDSAKQEYLLFEIKTGTNGDGTFDRLEELANLAINRAKNKITKPFIFIYIEECDLSCCDQKRFDNAVITINKNAKMANMKLIYSTSSPRPDTISKELFKSFDLLLVGVGTQDLEKVLDIPLIDDSLLQKYNFLVIEKKL